MMKNENQLHEITNTHCEIEGKKREFSDEKKRKKETIPLMKWARASLVDVGWLLQFIKIITRHRYNCRKVLWSDNYSDGNIIAAAAQNNAEVFQSFDLLKAWNLNLILRLQVTVVWWHITVFVSNEFSKEIAFCTWRKFQWKLFCCFRLKAFYTDIKIKSFTVLSM